MRRLTLLSVLVAGCAGAPGPTAVVSGDSAAAGAPVQARAAAAADSVLTIGAGVRGITLLGWLAGHGFLEGEPWEKLFLEPPLTGPRAGVDSTRYVDFFLEMAREQVVFFPDSLAHLAFAFGTLPPDSQVAWARANWRQGLFNRRGASDTCACGSALWVVAGERAP